MCSNSEDWFGDSFNINYTPSIRAAITLLENYPRGMKTYVHKNLYINIQRSFIDNGQKPEVIKKLFDKEQFKNCRISIPWITTQQQKGMNN